MKLATIRNDSGKWKVIDPREGKGVTVAKSAEEAIALMEAANAEITAAAEASSGFRIEIISRDGLPVNGITTTKATDAVVYVQKPSKTNKLTEPRSVTEVDLCEMTGYVIVSRDRGGKIRSEWSGYDFPKDVKVTPGGLASLARLFRAAE